MKSDAGKIISIGMEKMGFSFAGDQALINQLVVYFNELKKWNRKMNLVARQATDRDILEKHFLDSLALLSALQDFLPHSGDNQSPVDLMDVGTGAGFPGLVLKIALPELHVVLVEPRSKRVSFLKHIIRTLKLREVTVVESRLQDMVAGPDGVCPLPAFSFIVSRALTDIGAFLEMAKPFTTCHSTIICMKGPRGVEEMKALQSEESWAEVKLLAVKEYSLPFSSAGRLLLFFGLSDATRI